MINAVGGAGLLDGIAVIDADTHLTEPHDRWTARAPRAGADRVPQVHEVKGRSMWLKPSEYFRRQVHACYWFERDDVQATIDALGSDNILFETDFPHPTCLYPDSLSRAAEPWTEIEPAVRPKILSSNAASLYRIPVPEAVADTPG